MSRAEPDGAEALDPYLTRVSERPLVTNRSLVSIVGTFVPALDLGLNVTTRELAPLVALGGATTGSSGFDDELNVTADDETRAAALFTPALGAALLRLNVECPHFEMSDERVAFTADVADTVRWRGAAAEICRLVDLARGEVDPPARLGEHAAALRQLAAERGMTVEPTPMRLRGAMRAIAVEVEVRRRRRNGFLLELCARPPESFHDFGLRVRRETPVDRVGKWLGRQDLVVGDPVFDAAFLVQASEPSRALDALDAEARAALLALRDAVDDVEIGDGGLVGRVDPVRLDPSRLGALVGAAVAVVERVVHASGAVARGAYR